MQTNVSFSRRGVIRGLHYHERGQDDLFACLQGTARVVVLDRGTGATFTEDIGDENPVALYIPGRHAHGFEALTDLLFVYHVTEEYDPADPGRARASPGTIRASRHLWSTQTPIALRRGTQRRRVLITGAGGQLGVALARGVRGRRRDGADARRTGTCGSPPPPRSHGPISSCTRPPGRTSTAPRTIRRARPR